MGLDPLFKQTYPGISGDLDIFADFNRKFKEQNFQPDITGYVLIYLIPPNLSGGIGLLDFSNSPFLALDFTPPDYTLKTSEESGGIQYGTGSSTGGQLSINFIEDSYLNVTLSHNIWVNYIVDVVKGEVSPDTKFISNNDNFAELDYATSAYIVKFTPCMTKVTYVGKATGIFPINLPVKEILGNRQTNELGMVGMNYVCAMYSSYTPGANDWVLDNFNSDLYVWFGLETPEVGHFYHSEYSNPMSLFMDVSEKLTNQISKIVRV